MEDDPYSKFVDMMRSDNKEITPPFLRIGTVASENPLTVDIGGALQEQNALVFAEALPAVAVTVGTAEAHYHSADVSVKPPKYDRGDKLLLIPIEEEQRYIVLARLVGL